MRERGGERAEVLLVDDHTLFREGVVEIFAGEDDVAIVEEGANDLETTGLAKVARNAHRSVREL